MCPNNCFINMKLIKKQKVSDVTYVAPFWFNVVWLCQSHIDMVFVFS